MDHRAIVPFFGLAFVLIGLVGCDEIVNKRLDPASSSVSRHLLDRCGIRNDGSLISISGREVVLTSQSFQGPEVLLTYDSAQYSPIISPNNDKVVTFHYAKGIGCVRLSTIQSGLVRDFPLGQVIAVPLAFSSDGVQLLLHKYKSDGIGQGVVMRAVVLNLTNGSSVEIGYKAVVDSSGTHLLTLENGIIWKSQLGNASTKNRVTTGLTPIAVSMDGMKAIVSGSDQVLQLLDLVTGELQSLSTGHSALFMANGSIVVTSGYENRISIVRLPGRSEDVLTAWKNFNSIPVQSVNGRFFVFEKFENAYGTSRKTFVCDEESNCFSIPK